MEDKWAQIATNLDTCLENRIAIEWEKHGCNQIEK